MVWDNERANSRLNTFIWVWQSENLHPHRFSFMLTWETKIKNELKDQENKNENENDSWGKYNDTKSSVKMMLPSRCPLLSISYLYLLSGKPNWTATRSHVSNTLLSTTDLWHPVWLGMLPLNHRRLPSAITWLIVPCLYP